MYNSTHIAILWDLLTIPVTLEALYPLVLTVHFL
nr:MAG TPA: hypothetical protein [Caudoviricetes sp.]